MYKRQATLNPLCVLRYSATHREKINLLYRLTPVDAYQMGLVKQIAVSSNQVAGGFNQAYVRLLSVSNDKGFRARVELDVKGKTGAVTRKAMTVKPGDDLFLLSGGREPVSYTHLRAHETGRNLVCRLLLEKKKKQDTIQVR